MVWQLWKHGNPVNPAGITQGRGCTHMTIAGVTHPKGRIHFVLTPQTDVGLTGVTSTTTCYSHNTNGCTVTPTYSSSNITSARMLGSNTPSTPVGNPPRLLETRQEISNNLDSEPSRHNVFPNILLANIRSFGKGDKEKSSELDLVLKMNQIDVGVFTETWNTEDSIESLDFCDFTMFHLIRKNCTRPSGGISIFVRKDIPATRLKVNVPSHIETMYVSLRPKWLPRSVSNIIICGLYYPGSNSLFAPNQSDIAGHMIETLQTFSNKYAKPLFIILGDFNDLNFVDICETCNLKQVVNVPTRGNRTLDLILTNVHNCFYNNPVTLPSIGNSDHLCVLYSPTNYIKQKDFKKKVMVRIFKKSGMIEFGAWVATFNWILLYRLQDVNDKVSYFSKITWLKIDEIFPLQKIIISSTDKEWMTPLIKKLISQRQAAHAANLIDVRDCLAKKIRYEIIQAKINYNKSKARYFHMTNPREWFKHISKIIGNRNNTNTFINIPELAFKPVSEQIEIINNHFATTCKKYSPLNYYSETLFPHIDKTLSTINEIDTYKLLKKYAVKSLGPGDFPQRILIEFALEFSAPFCNIINCAVQSNCFPDAYKKAEITPIPKIKQPLSLSDLRPISKTPIGGKMIERVIDTDLDEDIYGKISKSQYGNCKGSSTTHYLIKLTHQAFKSTDRGHATTAITIDYSKAFDYVDHNILVEKLIKLEVRGQLIKLIISFLSNRSHNTCIQGFKSKFESISCGVPQGTVLGPKLFVILMNDDKCQDLSTYKFVDDKTLALSYAEDQTQTLQKALDLELEQTRENNMIINEKKCNIINFNFSRSNQTPQTLHLNDNVIQTTDKVKLLGVIISNDLSWTENTNLICSKVNKKIFIISKLKQFGFQTKELINAWTSILRPNAEYAAPLWHSGLSVFDTNRLERLQKIVLGIILGTTYIDCKKYYKFDNKHYSYDEALKLLGLSTLRQRREDLTYNFALQTVARDTHNEMFPLNENKSIGTRNKSIYSEFICKTTRYYKSAIPYMTRLLNSK